MLRGMCTLAIFREVAPGLPLIVAANRDEYLVRAADAPCSLKDVPGVVAGRDREAGGTWLGARRDGGALVAGLLNRRLPGTAASSIPGTRSRGLLCLDALGGVDVDTALAAIDPARGGGPVLTDYSRFNLLLADPSRAVVVDNGSGTEVRHTELGPGLSVLTNLDVNDPRCPRLASAVPRFEEVAARFRDGVLVKELAGLLQPLLGSHESSLDPSEFDELSRLCIHTDGYGTRSSTILAYDDRGRLHYFHADGAPCRAQFREIRL